MPELPEIEHLARLLRPAIVGRLIERVVGRRRGMLNVPPDEATALLRGVIHAVRRRGKEAVLAGERADAWLHLGLGGELRLATAADAEQAAAALLFADGSALVVDKVFMGHLHVLPPTASAQRWESYGLDPLDPAFDLAALVTALRARPRAALKAALTDQAAIAGIGNLYADEILLAAGLHPLRRVATLADEELRRLHTAVQTVLREALAAGGEVGYRGLDGRPGGYHPRIHRQPICGRCGRATVELRLGGRATTVCPRCQPPPSGGGDA